MTYTKLQNIQKYIILQMIYTNLLYSSKSLKYINQTLNKTSLNTKEMEMVLFKAQKTEMKRNTNFQISGQKIL